MYIGNERRNYKTDWAGRPLRVETGEVAKQAGGAALVYYGDTVVLSTVTVSKDQEEATFFPLTVNYEERAYAAGKIPGGLIKREGKAGERAILSARLIDRTIRPLFPEKFRHEVQVVNLVLSLDPDCSPQMAAMLGTSVALSLSEIPFAGPIAGVEIGRIGERFIVNPTVAQAAESRLHLTVAGDVNGIGMVEASADQIPEAIVLDGMFEAHETIKRLIDFETRIVAESGKKKMPVACAEADGVLEFEMRMRRVVGDRLNKAIRVEGKHDRDAAIARVRQSIVDTVEHDGLGAEPEIPAGPIDGAPADHHRQGAGSSDLRQVDDVLQKLLKEAVRHMIVCEHRRPDGRKIEEIRPLSARAGLLPRVHGSGLFTRGQTQVLSTCTLGPPADRQTLDAFGGDFEKRFFHHYNFPGFSTGEVKPVRSPGRREIGHGALGERALLPVLPSKEAFPYTIRCVSEVLESNGSSSQASICGSTLALMDAGVPIKAPVAGIAIGLVRSGDEAVVLTDIQGLEDAFGDMDFKCAGTENGVTALQMDLKISGVTRAILSRVLRQAREGRMKILETMRAALPRPRDHVSVYAPKILKMRIKPEKIGHVIGPGGKVINKIIGETGVKIDLEQNGSVLISSIDEAALRKARDMIESIVREVEIGATYEGTVTRIEKFGALVHLFGQANGLVHTSELDVRPVEKVEDVLRIGDHVRVKVLDIDRHGRIRLSRKAALGDPAAGRKTRVH